MCRSPQFLMPAYRRKDSSLPADITVGTISTNAPSQHIKLLPNCWKIVFVEL